MSGLLRDPLADEGLLLPGLKPSNMNVDGQYTTAAVTKDMFDICDRLLEIDSRLFVNELRNNATGETEFFSIMEHTVMGDKLVFKCNSLDQRALDKCKYLLKVPFEHRFERAEAMEAKEAEEAKQAELEALIENVGLPMHRDLAECGFIEHRGRSYAKRGVAAPGKSRG